MQQPILTAWHCDTLNQPFYQFAQMKQFAPDSIETVKAHYRVAWTDWKQFVQQVQAALQASGLPIGATHIERWCNGWQVRAHLFAFFKLAGHEHDAPILSLILNRQNLIVSLDWHAYRAAKSNSTVGQYHGYLAQLAHANWHDWHIWRGKDSEYAPHPLVGEKQPAHYSWREGDDFYRIGKTLSRDELAQHDCVAWTAQHLQQLAQLYARCFD
ncbi:HI_0552 family protein [Kingella kingae]|uniref:HI_0552 family protein n=1 Tax=Kingella kingae TaxID=504 RepID=UPI00041380C8|nr:HI_0552 family protein [Kingella kingae]